MMDAKQGLHIGPIVDYNKLYGQLNEIISNPVNELYQKIRTMKCPIQKEGWKDHQLIALMTLFDPTEELVKADRTGLLEKHWLVKQQNSYCSRY